MRRLLLPIIAVLVVILWLEPLTANRRKAALAHAEKMSPVAATAPAATTLTPPVSATSTAPVPATAQTASSKTYRRPTTATRPATTQTQPATTRNHMATQPASEPAAQATMPTTSFSWTQIRGQKGFWRIGQTTDGVWWFVSPENHVEFMNMVTTVQPYQLARDPRGTIYMSRDYDGSPTEPGNLRQWADRTLQRITATGFKGLGAWCHPVFHELPVPMTRDLNIWASAPTNSSRLYDPGWFAATEELVRTTVSGFRDNPYLVGYFLDNELDFSDARLGPSIYFDGLQSDNPNRRAVLSVIHELWPAVEQFNAAWDLHLKNYDELSEYKGLPKDPPDTYAHLQSAWLEKLMRDYFRVTTQLVRKHDPNHLIMGIRYAGFVPPEVAKASRDYTDAQSLNYYVSDAMLDPDVFKSIHELSGQPLIISEYSFHALDNRSGDRNTVGFQAQVTDQHARADAYRSFTTRLARVPWVIGADWFQWHDEPPSGRSADGEDVNFGVVDVDDREYPLLTDAIHETSRLLNPMHSESRSDAGKDLWRDDYTLLPTQHVPYLAMPIRINGELSDWPEAARLHNMRMTQTVGMDRSPVPAPHVYVGWRPEGLYIGAEVFDADPITAPINGRWWTRDLVELWVSTRPVTSDQTGYNQYSHQFIFLPTDPSMSPNGIAGSVGQWHRPGDALKDHLVPHPDIQYNCRILNDRYVFEMLIPASALHGWDPQHHPAMAFNVHLRNYQHAAAYFWSAPKEVQTQLRPKTWGNIQLDAATSEGYGPVDGHNNTLNALSRR